MHAALLGNNNDDDGRLGVSTSLIPPTPSRSLLAVSYIEILISPEIALLAPGLVQQGLFYGLRDAAWELILLEMNPLHPIYHPRPSSSGGMQKGGEHFSLQIIYHVIWRGKEGLFF